MSKKSKSSKKSDAAGLAEEAKEKLTEVDKEWFNIQIRALEEKLQRRNDKMNRLEQSNQDYQNKSGQLQSCHGSKRYIDQNNRLNYAKVRATSGG